MLVQYQICTKLVGVSTKYTQVFSVQYIKNVINILIPYKTNAKYLFPNK